MDPSNRKIEMNFQKKNQSHRSKESIVIGIVGSFSAWTADARVSGTVVSLKHLVRDLEARDRVSLELLDAGEIRRSSHNRLQGFLSLVAGVVRAIKRCDVVALHLSPNGFAILGPLVVVLSWIFRKPIVFRMFGGLDYMELSFLWARLAHWAVKRVDVFLVQTHELCRIAESRGIQTVTWFPTTRPCPSLEFANPHDKDALSYVFLGQIKIEKGIFELIKAFQVLGGEYQLNVYGPFYDGLDVSIFESSENVEYCGVAAPEDVASIMSQSKALVFPTYLAAEGYSGVVIESFTVGLPVLCSRWKFLPEIVNESCGILFEPKKSEAIVLAVQSFEQDPVLQDTLSSGAYAKRLDFSVESGTDRFIDACESALGRNR